MDWVGRVVDELDWTPLSLDIFWEEIEDELQCPLPGDFKDLCEAFGHGAFSGALALASSSGGSSLELLRQWRSLQRVMENDELVAEDFQRFGGVYKVGVGGLLPWANTYSGCGIYWLASDDPPEEWPIVVHDAEFGWSTYSMSASEFLFRVLADSDFPLSVAEYGPPFYYPAS